VTGHTDDDDRTFLADGGQRTDIKQKLGLIHGTFYMKPVVFPGSADVNQGKLMVFAFQEFFQLPGKHRPNPYQIPGKIPTDYNEDYNENACHIKSTEYNKSSIFNIHLYTSSQQRTFIDGFFCIPGLQTIADLKNFVAQGFYFGIKPGVRACADSNDYFIGFN